MDNEDTKKDAAHVCDPGFLNRVRNNVRRHLKFLPLCIMSLILSEWVLRCWDIRKDYIRINTVEILFLSPAQRDDTPSFSGAFQGFD